MGDALNEEFILWAKCEHRIWPVKRKYGLSPNPNTWTPKAHCIRFGEPLYKQKRARIKGYNKAFYSCSVFSFCRYIHFREICSRKMNSICFHYAANPQSSFFASGNPSRSSSIYCRFAPIRYEINPSFAKQTYRVRQHISNAAGVYRKSRKGFISMRDTPLEYHAMSRP